MNKGYKKMIRTFFRKELFERILTFVLISATVFSSVYYPTPVTPVKEVEADYTGKQMRTVEYVLGGGAGTSVEQTGTSVNNSVNRTSDTDVYAGTSWNTTKGSAGTKTVKIAGTGIRVVSAYLNYTASASSTAAIDVTDVELALAVTPGSPSGEDFWLDNMNRGNVIYHDNSGMPGPNVRVFANATGLFQVQSDAEFNAGLAVVARTSILGPVHNLMTLKLIITYEQDYSSSAHTETKTVRFPLDSTASGDIGSRQAPCEAASTCQFTYNANLPDLNTNADINDVWFEIYYTEDSTPSVGAATTSIGINGGAAGVAHKISQAVNSASLANSNRFLIYRPSVGGANFASGTTQTLDIAVTGTSTVMMGGELIVTYNYSTDAPSQTETISYWMNASTTLPTTATSTFAQDIVINNTGFSVSNAWYKIYLSPTATSTITASSTVGTAASRISNYFYKQSSPRNGEAVIIHDLSQDAASFSSATTSVQGQIRQSTASGDSGTSVELFVTFTWTGATDSVQTKTVKFFGANSGSVANISSLGTTTHPFNVFLSETVPKTYLSGYMKTSITHTDATAIGAGTIKIGFQGSSTITLSEATEDLESYVATIVHAATTTGFFSTSSIPWTKNSFTLSVLGNQAEEYFVTSELLVTYNAYFNESPQVTTLKTVRTVEYALGGGAGTSAEQTGTSVNNSVNRASDVDVFAGSSWDTTKSSAGTKTVKIAGTGIRVVSAYLNFTASASSTNSADLTAVELGLDVSPGFLPGNVHYLGTPPKTNILSDNSGTPGPNVRILADATSLFQIQSDSQFNSGLSIVGVVSILGQTFNLMTLKLVITYEQDYSSSAHTETKTVRFPLDSTFNSDIGTRTVPCTAGSTCQFTYNANLPDLNTNADINDVWFEVMYTEDNVTDNSAATTTIGINGGAAGVAHKITQRRNTGDLKTTQNRFLIYRPSVGGANFASGTTQTLDIAVTGTSTVMMGGELIVTYNYSTDAPSQTETISYWMNASTTLPTTATSTFAQDIVINNTGFSVSNAWYKIYLSPTATSTITASSTVGTAASRISNYSYLNAAARNNEVIIIHDLSQDAASFSSATTSVQGQIRQSTASGDSGTSVELFVTFTWTGSSGGPQTKTVKFFGGQSVGASNIASSDQNFVFPVHLPELVKKTYLSSYLKTMITHTEASSIATGNITLRFGGRATTTIAEATEDTEGYILTVVTQATSTDFTSTTTIPWTLRYFPFTFRGLADEYYLGAELNVTYKADFDILSGIDQLHYRFITDNGNQVNASFLQSEDTAIPAGANANKGERFRLRFLVSNTGEGAVFNVGYRLEHASSSCTNWLPVQNTESEGIHWVMDLTQYIPNASTSIDSSGLSNPISKSFKGGYVMTSANQTSLHNLLKTEFTEHEYSLRSTLSAETGLLYCFRLTNAGSPTGFTYSAQPQITLSSFNRNSGTQELEPVGSGPIQTGGGQGGGDGTDPGGSGGGQTGGGQGGGGGDVGVIRFRYFSFYPLVDINQTFHTLGFVLRLIR